MSSTLAPTLPRRLLLSAGALLLPLVACRSAYYGTLEKFGIQKRHILVDRVEEGRDAQVEAKEQFQSALDAFREVAAFDGGDLEEVYERLSDEHERSVGRADDVRERIASIQEVAEDLFAEWEGEIDEIQDSALRSDSQALLRDSQARYEDLIKAMKKAEEQMDPILASFNDKVLFLKHNLNARAVSSLQGQLPAVEGDVAALIRDMEASIAEADAFIASMQSES
jgi:hypothetical protein